MVHSTERKDRRKEKPVPHPEPLVKCPKTQEMDCLFGVRMRSAMQMAVEAMMLMGANQMTSLWRAWVVSEQIMPKIVRRQMERRTIWRGVLSR